MYEVGGMAVDPDGNLVVTGTFVGSLTLGGTTIESSSEAVFLAKLDRSGTAIFLKGYGNGATQLGFSVAVAPSGDIYLTGAFTQTINFGDTPDSTLESPWLQSAKTFGAPYIVYLAKLDAAGRHVWSKSFGNATYSSSGERVLLAPSGDPILGGNFGGDIDFTGEADGGDGGLVSGGGNAHTFLAEFTPSGESVWSRAYGVTGDLAQLFDLAEDSAGALYMSGNFENAVDFGGEGPDGGGYLAARTPCRTPVTCVEDAFVAKLDSSGRYVWGVALPASGHVVATGVAADDEAGSVVATGGFTGTFGSDGGPSFAADAGWGMFVAKFAAATGAPGWAFTPGLEGSTITRSYVAFDATGQLFLAYTGSDGEAGAPAATLARYDAQQQVWVTAGTGDGSKMSAIALDPCASELFAAGTFQGMLSLPGAADAGDFVLSAPQATPIGPESFIARFAR
jgi:hypothetical protein